MCAAREPRRFNGLCDTCCWLGHLSCDCLLQRDRIYSDVPALSSPPISPPSYSGHSGGPGYNIPCSPPQCNGSHCYRAKPFVRRYSGGDDTALSPQQQPAPRPFLNFVRDQRYNGGHSTAPPQQPAPRPFSSFVRDQRYNGGHRTAPQQQPGPLQARHQRRLQPPSGTLSPPTVVISDSAFEQWLQSDNMKIPMFSQSEGPQQSAPTAVTLAAAAPAAEAVTGTRAFPAVSLKGVAEAPASSAGAVSAAVPAAAPATGGTVFPTASVGGAARAPASADEIAALTAAPATGGTVLFAASVGGAPASSAVAATSAEISAAEPATSGNVPSAAPIGGTVGARESSTGAVSSDAATEAAPSTGGTAASAASTAREARALALAAGSAGEICGERGASTNPFDPGTVFPLEVSRSSDERARHNSSSGGSSSSSSNDNTSDHDSWWDATCVGALLPPFDPGKRCRRSTRRGKAVLGVDLPFDRGKAWGLMQHGG